MSARIEELNTLHEIVTPEEIFRAALKKKAIKTHQDRIRYFVQQAFENGFDASDVVEGVVHYFHVSEKWVKYFFGITV